MNNKLIYSLLLVICSLLLSSRMAIAADKLTMNMRDADIHALIQWISDNTGKNIIVHKAVQGKVTVLSPSPLTSNEAYQVFLSVLQVHGFAAIETAEALKIVPINLAKNGALPLENSSATADMVVSVMKIQNVSAVKLASILKPLASSDAVLTTYAPTNALVIADHSSNIASLKELIGQLDVASDSEIEVIKIKHADAKAIKSTLTTLMSAIGGKSESLTFSLSVDERSNTILMAGDPAKRKQFKNLIRQLDTPLEGQGNTQVVYLHYVSALEVAPILKSLATSIQSNQKDSNKINIESSESANALIINAPPSILNTMKRVISELDIRRAQVLVEALVVEVSGTTANDIGVTWISDSSSGNTVGGVNTLGDLALSNGSSVNSDSPLTFLSGRGLTFGYFEKGNLQAAIRALNATQNANILSTPTIVALDNEEASLLVGQNVPFKTGQTTSAASTTNDPFTTIERQDIGISLIVKPRINQGDSITLEIKQTTESIAPSVETASDIITNKREIITKALIKDDQILVLGGLISEEETEVQEKVPLLGDLPFIGALFRSKGVNRDKKNLMVFIHPVILKDEIQTREITQRRYNFMKNLQQKASDKEWSVEDGGNSTMEDFETFSPIDRNTGE
ncbi:MAG: general secretion pathway protein D [Oceanicoccus sp.]|jgi:general secretion pathway protein D